MNILFLLKDLNLGGVQVVTAVLAKKFVEEGHSVQIFALTKEKGFLLKRLDSSIQVRIGYGYCVCKKNIESLRNFIRSHHTEVVINQCGLPYIPIKVLIKATKTLRIKIISIYHSDPLRNRRIQKVQDQLEGTSNFGVILRMQKWLYTKITSCSMRYIYDHSHLFGVLSPSFIPHFKQFTGISDTEKLEVFSNPITINNKDLSYDINNKKKELIYVGRMDNVSKRINRIIDTWSHLENNFPDWNLTLIGDGDDRKSIEKQVYDLKLKRVSFEGFQKPDSYYERASILLLASEFEGWGLVVVEAMSRGVVPIVYHSYTSIDDIIEDDNNGILIPYNAQGFDAKEMADKCSLLMTDIVKREKLARNAILKSENYSIDKIYSQWIEKIEGLFNSRKVL